MNLTKIVHLDFSVPAFPPVIYVGQGETGRVIEFHLFDSGKELLIPTGASVALGAVNGKGLKVKKTITQSNAPTNIVSFAIPSKMTDEVGQSTAIIEITQDSVSIASRHFYIRVEENPAYEATESGSAVLQEKTVEATHYERIVTPDPGYDGLSKVTVEAIPTVSRATPTVTIDQSTGKITAQSVQSAGYVNAGTQTKTLQLPTVAGQTVTPGTTKKLIAAAGTYATGDIYVAADSSPTFITQPEKTVNVTSDANGNISPAYVVADSPYDALGRVNLAFSGGAINASKIKKGETILGVTGTYEGSGGGASVETVPVTILSSDYMKDTVDVLYTGLDDNGQPAQKTLYVTHTGELTYTINVVKGTTLMVQDNTGDYDIGYVTQSGFLSVDDFGNAVVCRVGDVACSITPAQVERASGGGSSIETVPVTIVDGENLRDTIQVIYTTVDSSGETMLDCLEVRHTDYPTHTINVVKGTTIQIVDLTGDYKIGYDSYDGFESVYDYDGTALFCDVTDTPSCEITPTQIEITSGGSAIETYKLTFTNVQYITGDTVCIPYVNENGELAYLYGYECLCGYEGATLNVPKNAILYISSATPIVCWDGAFEDVNDTMANFGGQQWCRMIMDTDIGAE